MVLGGSGGGLRGRDRGSVGCLDLIFRMLEIVVIQLTVSRNKTTPLAATATGFCNRVSILGHESLAPELSMDEGLHSPYSQSRYVCICLPEAGLNTIR